MKKSRNLARRNLWNAGTRVKSAELFYSRGEWNDVVRECTEALDFTFKSLLHALEVEFNRFQNPGEIFSKERHRVPPAMMADWETIDRIVSAGAPSGASIISPFGDSDFMTFGEPAFSAPSREEPSAESALSALSDARYMVGLAKEVCRHLHGIQGTRP